MFKFQENIDEYIKNALKMLHINIKRNKFLFNFINVIIFVVILCGGVLTPIIMSEMLSSSFPTWFFFVIAGLAAITTLLTGILNFFLLKENFLTKEKKKILIEQELIKFNDKLSQEYKTENAEYNLFITIASILGSKPAKKEVNVD